MTPAELVIQRFGGVRPLARLLKRAPSSVHRWTCSKEKHGSEGRIPSNLMALILSLAKEQGIPLEPAELIHGSPAND